MLSITERAIAITDLAFCSAFSLGLAVGLLVMHMCHSSAGLIPLIPSCSS